MAFDRSKALKAAQKHLAKGNLEKAVAEYERLAADDPRDARVLLKLGDLYGKRGDKAKACATYRKVADHYAEQGFFLKAVAIFKQILKIDSGQLDAWEKLGEMYELLSLVSDALSTYEHVANAYNKVGNNPRALDAMGKIAQLDPNNVANTIKYAEALSKVHRREEAVEAFLQGATVLKRQGRLDDYVKVSERLLYHQPDNMDVARELATLYLERNDPKHALAKLQACFKADPKDLATLDLLARAFEQLDQAAKAVSVYREIQRIAEGAGDLEVQVDALRRLLALDPNDGAARTLLTRLDDAAPRDQQSVSVPVIDLSDAEPEEDDIILVDDEDSDVIALEGSVATALPGSDGEVEEAIEARIDRMMGECEAFIRYRLDDKVEAQLLAVLSLDPHHVLAHVKLGNFYADAGRNAEAAGQYVAAARAPGVDPASARQYLELAAELDPSNPGAHDALLEERPTASAARPASVGTQAARDQGAEPDDDIIFLDDDLGDDTEPDLSVEDADDLIFDEPLEPDDEAAFFGSEGALDGEPEMVLEDASEEDAQLIAEAEEALFQESSPPAPQATFSDGVPTVEAPAVELSDALATPVPGGPPPESLPPLVSSAPPAPVSEPAPFIASEPPVPAPDLFATPIPNAPPAPASEPVAVPAAALAPAVQAAAPAPAAPIQALSAPSPPPASDDDDDEDLTETLEEADFYRDQGLMEEAVEAIQEALFCYPNHPALVAKLRELTGEEGDGSDDDQSFALAEKLAEEDAPGASPADAGAIAVNDVIAKFKAGVEKAVDKDDAATHYDLGIAYMEMGLHAEAIGEFELCLSDPGRQCQAHTMIAFSHVSEGKMDRAIEHFKAALEHNPEVGERMELWFELGNAYELLGKASEALVYYEKVEEEDPTYRDVAARIERLGIPPTPKDEEDEFDAMFDNMILKD